MKKEKFLIFGLLVGLLLAIGMVLAACDDGTPPGGYPDTYLGTVYGVHGSGGKIIITHIAESPVPPLTPAPSTSINAIGVNVTIDN